MKNGPVSNGRTGVWTNDDTMASPLIDLVLFSLAHIHTLHRICTYDCPSADTDSQHKVMTTSSQIQIINPWMKRDSF